MYLIVCNLALNLNKPLKVFSQHLSSFCLSDTPDFSQSSSFLTYKNQFKSENIFFLFFSFFFFFFNLPGCRCSCGLPWCLTIKNQPAMQETREMWVQSLGWEDHLEKEMATYSSVLAWQIPWTEEPSWPQSVGLQRIRHD